jgi:hypothetical protein
MIFNSKQLEELENIHDSTGAFEEEGEDESGFDEVGEAAMDWRRGLIEEAAENIKRAKGRPVESHLTYPIGSMLFERDARRFARVQRSVPGYLKIVYLSGGDREFGTLDVQAYLRDYGADKRLSELSEQLGMNDGDVAIQLERLGITPLEEPDAPEEPELSEEEAAAAAAAAALQAALTRKKGGPAGPPVELPAAIAPVVAAKAAAAKNKMPPAPPAPAPVVRKGDAKPAAAPAKADKPAPAKAEKAEKAEKPAKAKAPEKAEKADKAVDKKAPPAKTGKAINPIDDPNSYIKANYSEMSNRELARVTGLSEHTIRRKLGEWSLKRKAG